MPVLAHSAGEDLRSLWSDMCAVHPGRSRCHLGGSGDDLAEDLEGKEATDRVVNRVARDVVGNLIGAFGLLRSLGARPELW